MPDTRYSPAASILLIGCWALAALAASGCIPEPGHHSSGSVNINVNDGTHGDFPVVTIDGSGTHATVVRSDIYDVDISGASNSVDISDGQTIHLLHIDGSGQHVHVGHGCTIGSITIDGVSCELQLPTGSSFTIIDDGLSTTITYYTSG